MKLTLSEVPQREPHAVRAVARRDITPRQRKYHAHRRGPGRRVLQWVELLAGAATLIFVGWVFIVLAFLVTP